MGYRQLTQAQRYQISALLTVGRSQRQIAETLGCHNTTISREIRRNSGGAGYEPDQTQHQSEQRRACAYKAHKQLSSLIHWVSGVINASRPSRQGWVKFRTAQVLSNARRRWRPGLRLATGKAIPCSTGTSNPALRHWFERRSGYLLAGRLPQIRSTLTANAIIRLLKPIRGAIKTLTLDNGSEFAEHQRMAEALNMATYFCDPYCSGQRGTNENTNGLIRQYHPKGTDFSTISQQALNQVVDELNNRSGKRLGYRTPAEIFWGEYSGVLKTSGAALIT